MPVLASTGKAVPLRDLPARIIGIPLVATIMYLAFEQSRFHSTGPVAGMVVSFLYTLAYWEGIRQIWIALANRFPHYSQTRKRIVRVVLLILIYGAFLAVVIPVFSWLVFGEACTPAIMLWGYLAGFIPTGVVLILYEAVFFFESWKKKVQEAEALERSQLVNQLDALKAQLDPHFLFNSLNTLSSLIDENEPAQQYLSRLADVYRYVLLSRERNTVTLKAEMDFAEAYLYLAKVRFQTGLEVEISISSAAMTMMVAPLSIQILVENALKHNVVSREHPLKISIREEDGYIRVSNAIRPREVLGQSTRLGLRNIMEQYRLLSDLPVRILGDSYRFEVGIPLLPS